MSSEFDGVAFLKNTGVLQATGVLLWSGKHILTAAHFADDISDSEQIEIGFNSTIDPGAIAIAGISIHPGWENNPNNFNFDLAIIELDRIVDSQISGYEIYRSFDEVGQDFSRVGYGVSVDPETGIILDSNKSFQTGNNHYDSTTDQVNSLFGSSILEDYQLSYDFDDGSAQHDAYGRILGLDELGAGSEEIFSNPGFSGGPAFIDKQIAGIASYIFRYESDTIDPDITTEVDSSYGELASDTRVAKFADWIDSVVLEEYVPAIPTQKEQVDLFPVEGDSGTSINYFLLSIPRPLAFDSGVLYETIDGTAKAGSDYIHTSGQAIIPAGETSVSIAVQLLGDTLEEDHETFGLRVYEPFGGSFPEGIVELVAEHTIIDNDQENVFVPVSADVIV